MRSRHLHGQDPEANMIKGPLQPPYIPHIHSSDFLKKQKCILNKCKPIAGHKVPFFTSSTLYSASSTLHFLKAEKDKHTFKIAERKSIRSSVAEPKLFIFGSDSGSTFVHNFGSGSIQLQLLPILPLDYSTPLRHGGQTKFSQT